MNGALGCCFLQEERRLLDDSAIAQHASALSASVDVSARLSMGAEASEFPGGCCADSGTSAGDERDLPFEDAIFEDLAVHGPIMPQLGHPGEAVRCSSVL